jgi:hypothetical protein
MESNTANSVGEVSRPEGLTPTERQAARDIFLKEAGIIETFFLSGEPEGVSIQTITTSQNEEGLCINYSIIKNPHRNDDGSFVGPTETKKMPDGTLLLKNRTYSVGSDNVVAVADRILRLSPQEGKIGCYDVVEAKDQSVSDSEGNIARFGKSDKEEKLLIVGEAMRRINS